jgi:hypothetical protein
MRSCTFGKVERIRIVPTPRGPMRLTESDFPHGSGAFSACAFTKLIFALVFFQHDNSISTNSWPISRQHLNYFTTY